MANLMLVNPRKRRRRKTTRKRSTGLARRVTRSVSTYRRRRNPARRGGLMGDAVQSLQKGAVGAGGALLVDVVMSRVPMLADIGGPQMKPIVRGAVAVGVGMIAGNIMKNKKLGKDLTEGAMTIALYNTGKQMLGPQLGLNGYMDGDLLGDYDDGLLGYGSDDLGYYGGAESYARPEGMDGMDEDELGYSEGPFQ